ncbi:amino acid transporter [Aspergillus violaceofuscus CBS 115571]|uniref:Amino acid transporter n=1 Tax=Aspergillus violaceofuscus (strain CBS 115571) TaxID=1450538 RepID=A0A2V5HJ76_ASPV1|nr:amino acid transporter [Aspergillus violaceofuscus CBS 115571]
MEQQQQQQHEAKQYAGDLAAIELHSPSDGRRSSVSAPINASGHKQELDRNFGFINICGLALTSGNTWIALGGSIVTAIYDGGPPGVIYEMIAASFFYWFIAASLAELASSMPSSGGVYHWATITAGRYGRPVGFFAGWWNFLAWIFGAASTTQILGTQVVSAYALFHPDYTIQRWHVFIAYLICSIGCCLTVAFANRALPMIESVGGALTVAGFLITVIVCAVMPHVNGQPYATDDFVWRDWLNEAGYSSNGFVFCLGMLNGAFAVGTPDVISHLAEEVPQPGKNIPIGMLAQYVMGFFTAFLYLIVIFYGITDLDAVLDAPYLYPLTEIYVQITGSRGGSLGLIIVSLLPLVVAIIGCYLTSSRVLWTLARDGATPFSGYLRRVDPTHKNPLAAVLVSGVIPLVLGCIYVGNSTAFSAFVSSFVVLTTISYLAAILPHLLRGRQGIPRGWFWMSGPVGFIVNGVTCAFIIVFIVIFCFPFSMPVDAETMNYTCLITGGFTILIAAIWVAKKGDYQGPTVVAIESEALAKDAI